MREVPEENSRHIESVLVVVPARNEQGSIKACLDHLQTAIEHLSSWRSRISVDVRVVLDGCSDGTAALVAEGFGNEPWLKTHFVEFLNVGRARGYGVRRAMESCGANPSRTLIGSTDADSRVPPDWLSGMVRYLEAGSDVVLGTIRPDSEGLEPSIYAAWHATYTNHAGHGHVHGANLGVRASWYAAVGGFHALESDEDVQLVQRLVSAGAKITSCAALGVVTSSRLDGRAPRGFAGFLSRLDPAIPIE